MYITDCNFDVEELPVAVTNEHIHSKATKSYPIQTITENTFFGYVKIQPNQIRLLGRALLLIKIKLLKHRSGCALSPHTRLTFNEDIFGFDQPFGDFTIESDCK